ncbi:hypothetical protein V8E52_011492 [Russula decolorans]|jgi:hypothetical protein
MERCLAPTIPFLHALWVEWIVYPALALTIMCPMAVPACHYRSTSTNNASCIILRPPCRFKRLQCLLDLGFIFLLARRQQIYSMHLTTIMTVHDFTIFMEPIMATLYIRNLRPYDQSSNSQLHLPSQHLQFHIASLAEQNSGESAAASNSGRKRKSSSTKITQPRKRPRVPAVPTTEPPGLHP